MTEDEAGREVTGWSCSCGFYAYENEHYHPDGTYRFEQFARACTSCGSSQDLKLHREGREYLWCSRCHLLTEQLTDTAG